MTGSQNVRETLIYSTMMANAPFRASLSTKASSSFLRCRTFSILHFSSFCSTLYALQDIITFISLVLRSVCILTVILLYERVLEADRGSDKDCTKYFSAILLAKVFQTISSLECLLRVTQKSALKCSRNVFTSFLS